MLSLTRTWAVMAKEFTQLTRDRLTYAMILLLPIVQLLLFGYAINDDPRNLPTAVLVQDNGGFSRSILTAMNNSGYFDVVLQARSQSELDRALERGEVQFAVIIQATVILVMARLLFDVPMSGGWLALIAGLTLFIVGSLSLGFLISTLAKTQLQAMQMSFFYMLPSILLSGFMFPFRGMPDWAQAIGTAIPVTHFLRVVRGSLLKGAGLENAGPSLFALGLFVLVVGTLAMLRYRTTLD